MHSYAEETLFSYRRRKENSHKVGYDALHEKTVLQHARRNR